MPSVSCGNQYLKLVHGLGEVLADTGLPSYGSRFSRKDFTLHQHVIMLVLRSRERKPYRDFVDWLEVSTEITVLLGIEKIPHYTTLQKVSDRLPPGMLEEVMAKVAAQVVGDEIVAGIDGTGFSLDFSSRYYCRRIKRQDKHQNYLKTSIVGDMNTQVIVAAKLRLKRRHDIIDLTPLLRKTRRRTGVSAVVADKGYDSEDKMEFIEEEVGALAVISLKNKEKPLDKTTGKRRRKLKQEFPEEIYHQRSKVETIISVVKRKYGSTLHSRKHRTKKNECLLKLIAYNIHRTHTILQHLYTRISTKLFVSFFAYFQATSSRIAVQSFPL